MFEWKSEIGDDVYKLKWWERGQGTGSGLTN